MGRNEQAGSALRVREGKTSGLPAARVVEFQAINAFHRFDPMEVVASEKEVHDLVASQPGRAFLLFPEDREHPIRMADELPLRWIRQGPRGSFTVDTCRGEFLAFQIGLYAAREAAEELAAEFGDLTSGAGATIPAGAIRCPNLGGVDWLGRPLRKTVNVARGKVQALWFGVAVPRDAQPGKYRGTLTLRAKNVPASEVKLTLNVADRLLEDAGDSEPWRHSRLRWLDSTIGLDDDVFAPYTPVKAEGRDVSVLGRTVRLAGTGLFSSIVSRFARNVDGIDGPPREILAEPMRLLVLSKPAAQAEGATKPDADDDAPAWQGGKPRIVSRSPGRRLLGGHQHRRRDGTALPRQDGMRRLRELPLDPQGEPCCQTE